MTNQAIVSTDYGTVHVIQVSHLYKGWMKLLL
jgi:hypothetical protein